MAGNEHTLCAANSLNAAPAPRSKALARAFLPATLLGFALVLALNGATVVDAWKLMPDNCYYMELARSLAAGEGYRYQGEPHTCFPPGWPLLLAIGMKAGLVSWWALRAVAAALAVLAAGAASIVALPRLGRWGALAAAVLFGASPHLIVLGPLLYSDVAYTLWSLLALMGLSRLERSAEPKLLTAGLAGACSSLAMLTRTVGAGLGVAGVIVLGLRVLRAREGRKRWVAALAIYVGVAFVPVAAWGVRSALVSPAGERTNRGVWMFADPYDFAAGRVDTAGLLERLGARALAEASHLGQVLCGAACPMEATTVVLLVLAVLVVPLTLKRFLRSSDVLGCYAILYFLTYSLWPFNEGTRFMLPLAPIVWTLVLETALSLPLPRRLVRALLSVAVLIVLGVSLAGSARVLPGVRSTGSPLGDGRIAESGALQVGLYLRDKTPPQATFMTFPGTVEVEISGRKLIAADTTADAEVLYLQACRADYIVARDSPRYSQAVLLAMLRAHPEHFELVASLGDRFVFRRRT
ncbi:MAG: glycosyltransferase family 39 protein [Planctomycetota bacterium]